MAPRVTADHLRVIKSQNGKTVSIRYKGNLRIHRLNDRQLWNVVISVEVVFDLLAQVLAAPKPADEQQCRDLDVAEAFLYAVKLAVDELDNHADDRIEYAL